MVLELNMLQKLHSSCRVKEQGFKFVTNKEAKNLKAQKHKNSESEIETVNFSENVEYASDYSDEWPLCCYEVRKLSADLFKSNSLKGQSVNCI